MHIAKATISDSKEKYIKKTNLEILHDNIYGRIKLSLKRLLVIETLRYISCSGANRSFAFCCEKNV